MTPSERGSFMHRIFPSHPPIERRIELIARMGSDIGREALEAALEAGAEARRATQESVAADAMRNLSPPKEVLTPLFERPDGWSKVLAQLPQDAQMTLVETEGNFIRVRSGENVVGYVARSAPLRRCRQRPTSLAGNPEAKESMPTRILTFGTLAVRHAR